MSTRANIRLITFCMFLILAMLVVSSVLIFTAGQQNIESLISIEFTVEKVKLNFANYDGTVVTPGNCNIVLNADKTKFKIVGPTPIIEDSTATSQTDYDKYDNYSSVETSSERIDFEHNNGSENTTLHSSNIWEDDRSALVSGPTGKVSSIDDLTNSSGAEFYYFCTNSAVIGSTAYTDPGTVYYTSTADDTLENWYDRPQDVINLYSCFMIPNYTTEEKYSGSDTRIIISNKITNIPSSAFQSNTTITNVLIPQSVKIIKSSAFDNCIALTTLVIPNCVTEIKTSAFDGCSGLTSVLIGSGVTNIETYAFTGLNSLTNIVIDENNSTFYCSGNCIIKKSNNELVAGFNISIIPNNVTSIAMAAFRESNSIISITIPDSVTKIGNFAFYSCSNLSNLVITSGLTDIGYSAFSGCGLTSITVSENNSFFYSTNNCLIKKSNKELILGCKNSVIPSGVISIGNGAFNGCKGITSLTIPSTVLSIGDSAFYGCSKLTSANLGTSVTSIGKQAFFYCSSLKNLTISDSVTSIGEDAFDACSSLNYNVIDSVKYLGNDTNPYVVACDVSITTRTSYNLESGVKVIYSRAFYSCKSLTSITLPNSVVSIGVWAFYGCTSLSNVILSSNLISIGKYAFRGCSLLTAITIPSNVSNIGSYAFYQCSGLTSITFSDSTNTWKAGWRTVSVTDPAQNATNLVSSYYSSDWTKNS